MATATDRPDDSIRQLHTDPNIDAYQGYIPDDWGPTHIAPLPNGTVIERLVLNLAVLWRTASYTAQMPATAVRAAHAAAIGRGKYVTTDRSIVAYTDDILGKLAAQTTRLARDPALAARMRKALLEIATEKRDRLEEIKDFFPIEYMWADFMKQDAFRLGLWESQRSSYLAFYNAYEAFLVSVLKVGTGRTSLRTVDRDFKEVLRTGLTEDIADPCWFHGDIHLAREVRNALSHNGGQESPALKKMTHKLKVIGEDLHIVAGDVHRMLKRLRLAVEKTIAVTKGDAKFLAKWTPPENGE